MSANQKLLPQLLIPSGLEHLAPNYAQEMVKDLAALERGNSQNLDLAEHLHAMRGKCAMFGDDLLYALLVQFEQSNAQDQFVVLDKIRQRVADLVAFVA